MKILIVEDDPDIAAQLADYLATCGFIPHVEHHGEEGLFEGEHGVYDAVLLDLGLPGMDGLTILEKWRSAGKTMPVLILTARTSKMETVRGLEIGADDYIYKPFDLDEIAARLRNHITRSKGLKGQLLSYNKVSFDMRNGRILVNGKFIKLTHTEFMIVQYLFLNQGRPIGINELIDHTYEDFDNDSGIIPKHIANIRKKLGHDVILTETNRGYYIPLPSELDPS